MAIGTPESWNLQTQPRIEDSGPPNWAHIVEGEKLNNCRESCRAIGGL